VQLALPADAFVDAAGLPFSGTVTVLFAPTGPTAAELAGAPGPLVGTPSGGGGPEVLSAAFLADIRFVAPDGSALQLAAGKTATLTYTLPESIAQLYAAGQTLGGWFFDLTTATWQQDGESVVQEDPLTGAKSVSLAVGHFSWWLIASGAKAESCVRVTVTEDGVPKAGAIIQVLGLYAQGYQIGSSGADGSSCIVAPADTDVLVQVSDFFSVQTGGGQMVHTNTVAATCGEAAGCVEVQVALVGPKACAAVDACDDSNSCTKDECAGGQCIHYQATGGGCDDGNTCTTNGTCLAGACSAQLAVCNDNNPCTNDICQNGKGCVYTPNTGFCDDGDGCTLGDTCSNATCGAGGPKDCDDDNVCTVDLCEAPSGTCVHNPTPGDCDDNTACSAGDTCTDGICAGLPNSDLCDDGNVCTTDVCDLQAQSCVNAPAGGPCDDGDVCSGGDACADGVCITQGQKPANYVDQQLEVDYLIKWSPSLGNVLWQQVSFDETLTNGRLLSVEMSLGVCGIEEFPGATFALQLYDEQSGQVATSAAVPFAGLPTTCELTALDANKPGPAVFQFAGTGAPIVKGKSYWLVLVHSPITCPQGCAAELQASAIYNTFYPLKGSVFVAISGQLPPQTTGLRMAFKTVVVDDLNVLTNGTSCDDGIDCTVADACSDGTCKGTASCDDGLACTLDACETTGCQHTPNDALCEDDDACSTVDTCDTTEGCLHTGALADGETCTDGNLCTVSGSCLGGKCVVVDKDCEDGDFCTVNYCDRKYGSGNCASDSANCDDGNDCTQDFCTNGACAPQVINQAIQCDDGVECTWYATCQAGVCTPSGGSTCPVGAACAFDAGCESEKCVDGLCAFSTCHDKVLSGDESDIDCGGTCTKKCFAGQKCNVQTDCDQNAYNKYCSASQGICWSNPN
jgi:hypothetical protein